MRVLLLKDTSFPISIDSTRLRKSEGIDRANWSSFKNYQRFLSGVALAFIG